MNDIPNGQWKYLAEWRHHLWITHPKIPKECKRSTLLIFCFALAERGSAGSRCFASNQVVAKMIGVERKYLKKYRWLAVELGWFEPTGEKQARVGDVLRISIPRYQEGVPVLPDQYRDKPTGKRSAPPVEKRERSQNPKVEEPEDYEDCSCGDPWCDGVHES